MVVRAGRHLPDAVVSVLVALGMVMSAFLFSPQPVYAQVTLRAAGGGVGGTWYSTLASLAELFKEKVANVNVEVVPGGGVANPVRVAKGDVELAWSYPPFTAAALEGRNPYKTPEKGIRGIATGFNPGYLHLVVTEDTGVHSIEEIVKKKIPLKFVTGKKSTTTGWFFDHMWEYFGISPETIESWGGKVVYAAYGDWPNLVKDGHANAWLNQIALPDPLIQEIQIYKKLRLLPFPEDFRNWLAKKYSLSKVIIPAKTYPFQPEDLPTVTMYTALVANEKVPADVVYRLTKAMAENADRVRAIHRGMKEYNPSIAWENTGAPLHPGAERYYREKKYMK